MNTAASEWAARVAARNKIETAQATCHPWVRRCQRSRAAGALSLCALRVIDDANFRDLVVEMAGGQYRFAPRSCSHVYGCATGAAVRRHLADGSARILDTPESRLMIEVLNNNLSLIHGGEIAK